MWPQPLKLTLTLSRLSKQPIIPTPEHPSPYIPYRHSQRRVKTPVVMWGMCVCMRRVWGSRNARHDCGEVGEGSVCVTVCTAASQPEFHRHTLANKLTHMHTSAALLREKRARCQQNSTRLLSKGWKDIRRIKYEERIGSPLLNNWQVFLKVKSVIAEPLTAPGRLSKNDDGPQWQLKLKQNKSTQRNKAITATENLGCDEPLTVQWKKMWLVFWRT